MSKEERTRSPVRDQGRPFTPYDSHRGAYYFRSRGGCSCELRTGSELLCCQTARAGRIHLPGEIHPGVLAGRGQAAGRLIVNEHTEATKINRLRILLVEDNDGDVILVR